MDRQEASAGVLEMLGTLEFEIQRDTKEAQVEEANHKASFQLMRKDALEERTVLVESLMKEQAVSAKLTQEVHKLEGQKASTRKEALDVERYLHELEDDCNFLLENYDVRKKSRDNEREALRRAADVLSSA